LVLFLKTRCPPGRPRKERKEKPSGQHRRKAQRFNSGERVKGACPHPKAGNLQKHKFTRKQALEPFSQVSITGGVEREIDPRPRGMRAGTRDRSGLRGLSNVVSLITMRGGDRAQRGQTGKKGEAGRRADGIGAKGWTKGRLVQKKKKAKNHWGRK